MQTAKATLSNFRQAPRKMRLVASLVAGKKVSDVLVNLEFTTKKAALPIKILIESALANAKMLDIPTENLIIKTITVNAGKIMYRRMPAAHGSAHPIRKRTSQIFVELSPRVESKKSKVIKEKAEDVVLAKETKVVKGSVADKGNKVDTYASGTPEAKKVKSKNN